MTRTVAIDCFPENVKNYSDHAIVAVDVIRATTMAITAVACGRRCSPAATLEEATLLADRWKAQNPLLAGELGGSTPYGFEMTNTPAGIAQRDDIQRPLILLSTSGTVVIRESVHCQGSYVACLRNYRAQSEYLAGRHDRIAVIGAGSRGEFREEDQLCCAWIAEGLVRAGYRPANEVTGQIIQRWSGAKPDAFLMSKSVEYLRRTQQAHDLDFILAHVDDLSASFELRDGEIVMVPTSPDPGNVLRPALPQKALR